MRDLLTRWDEHLIWVRRLLAAERGAYARGHTDGHAAGYAQAVAEFKAGHHAVVADLHAERVMWGGRRDQFARPRPGDYQGTEAQRRRVS
jgi:hypothetical protein